MWEKVLIEIIESKSEKMLVDAFFKDKSKNSYMVISDFLFNKGNVVESLECLKEAISYYPFFVPLRLEIARIYFIIEKYDEISGYLIHKSIENNVLAKLFRLKCAILQGRNSIAYDLAGRLSRETTNLSSEDVFLIQNILKEEYSLAKKILSKKTTDDPDLHPQKLAFTNLKKKKKNFSSLQMDRKYDEIYHVSLDQLSKILEHSDLLSGQNIDSSLFFKVNNYEIDGHVADSHQPEKANSNFTSFQLLQNKESKGINTPVKDVESDINNPFPRKKKVAVIKKLISNIDGI